MAAIQIRLSWRNTVARLLLLELEGVGVGHILLRLAGENKHAAAVIFADMLDAKASSIVIAQGFAGGRCTETSAHVSRLS